jgi:hypothetical protein
VIILRLSDEYARAPHSVFSSEGCAALKHAQLDRRADVRRIGS